MLTDMVHLVGKFSESFEALIGRGETHDGFSSSLDLQCVENPPFEGYVQSRSIKVDFKV